MTEEETTETPDQSPEGPRSGISSEARGLVDDIKKWVDLKVQLLQLDIEQRIEGAANRILHGIIVGMLAFLTLIFLLFTVAYGLGALWYSDTLGFLTVTLLLAVATFVFRALRPSLLKLREMKDAEKTELPEPRAELPEGTRPPTSIADTEG